MNIVESVHLAGEPVTAPERTPKRNHRPNGKVARLPVEMRNMVNQSLRDGRRYREIIASLTAQGYPDLTEHNVSHWAKGGYRQWLAAQERFEARRPLSDKAQAILGRLQSDGRSALADLNEELLVVYFHELLESFDTPDFVEKSEEFLRVARVMAAFMMARAQRQKVDVDRLSHQLELRQIEWEKSKPKNRGLSPETIRQIEEAAKML